MRRILVISILGVLGMAGDGTGCFGPNRPDEASCPAVMCEACVNGYVKDANGCDTCECAKPTVCAADSDCASGLVCDRVNYCEVPPGCTNGAACPAICYGRCVTETKPPVGCGADSACAPGEFCDFSGGCAVPPCEDGGMCPPVACEGVCKPVGGGQALCEQTGGKWEPYACGNAVCGNQGGCDAIIPGCNCGTSANFVDGKGCVEDPSCQPNVCDGAARDSRGNCLGAWDQPLPDSCCAPLPSKCGDGSQVTCHRTPPACTGPMIAAVLNGCYVCVDPKDCAAECSSDTECGAGSACVQRTWSPCDDIDGGPQCGAPTWTYSVCEAGTPPSQCQSDADCAAGEACVPDPTDPCNQPNVDCFRAGRMICQPSSACTCTQEYAPVCGVNGQTYGNACEAKCANVAVATQGECKPACTIECFAADPVCGADGVTYYCGEPDAKCHGTTVAYAGECQAPSGCMADSECQLGDKCFFDPRADAASGRCEPTDYCVLPTDCDALPQPISCAGAWSCDRNHCGYACTR